MATVSLQRFSRPNKATDEPLEFRPRIEHETLSDGSHVFNVHVPHGSHSAVFYATDEAHAQRLLFAIEACPGWTIE